MVYCDQGEHLFVVGSARSGTSLMSSIVQTATGFAAYRAETKLLNSAQSKYGSFANKCSREKFFRDWFNSRQFKRTGLTEKEVLNATSELNSYISFLGTYMTMVARKQGCDRWIDGTPSNANCLQSIAVTFPRAKVIHMVRDGRAVALSLAKLGWSGVKTDSFNKQLCFSALKWQLVVETVEYSKDCLGDRLLKVKYEELVNNPSEVLSTVSEFLQIPAFDLDLFDADNVEATESDKSSLKTPNSLFGDVTSGISKSAAYRWKTVLSEDQIRLVDANISKTLIATGYPVDIVTGRCLTQSLVAAWRRLILRVKRFTKHRTLLGRLSNSSLEIGFD